MHCSNTRPTPQCNAPADERKADAQAVVPESSAAGGAAAAASAVSRSGACLCSNRVGGGGAERPAGPAEGAVQQPAAELLEAAREAGDNTTMRTFVGHMRRLHRCRLALQVRLAPGSAFC